MPLHHSRHQHLVRRPTRRRQDHARGGARPRSPQSRAARLLQHRRRPRRPIPQSRHRSTLGHRHAILRRPSGVDHRLAPLPPNAHRRRQRPVPGHLLALPQIQRHLDHQPRRQRLRRPLRRHRHRRRHARPAPSPLQGHQHHRRQLPTTRPPSRATASRLHQSNWALRAGIGMNRYEHPLRRREPRPQVRHRPPQGHLAAQHAILRSRGSCPAGPRRRCARLQRWRDARRPRLIAGASSGLVVLIYSAL